MTLNILFPLSTGVAGMQCPLMLVYFFKQISIPPVWKCLGTETSVFLRRGRIIPPWVIQPRMGAVTSGSITPCGLPSSLSQAPAGRLFCAQSTNHTGTPSLTVPCLCVL